MKTYKLKDLYKNIGTGSLLFDSYLSSYYPDITGNESNFLTDYNSAHSYFDKAFAHKFGERYIDLEAETIANAITEFKGIVSGVTLLNLSNWARLYYALSLDYNPLYNVDGLTTFTHGAQSETYTFGKDKTTNQFGATQDTMQYGATQDTTQYGATQDTMQYGATEDTTEYGATSRTEGQHTNTDTDYAVSYDSATEKETGKHDHNLGSQTITELLHTDKQSSILHSDVASSIQHSDVASSIQHSDVASSLQHTDTAERDARTDGKSSLQYIDTELRQGNIGVTKSTDLLEAETLYRSKMGFWDTIFKTLANEGGLYYGWC